MKQLFCLPLVFLFCISITSFAQNPEWINYTERIEKTNAIIPDFQVNDVTGSAAKARGFFPPSISTESGGNFVITWTDERNGDWDIYAQRYSSDGSALGTNFKVNDDQGSESQAWPSISTDGSGNFVITWDDRRNGNGLPDIYAQRYSSDGSPLGSNFKVNDDQVAAFQWSPSISTDDSGNFVITWTDGRNDNGDIYAQRYSSDGSALGTNFKVNDDWGFQLGPSISTDNSGNFVITWMDQRNGLPDIYAQRYSSDGSPLGTNFKVNDDLGSYWQRSPHISTDSSGNFVITWMDQRNAGSGDIYAQRYSSDGSTLGTNFKVNDDQGNAGAGSPSISTDGSGNFVIIWSDYRNGDWDIYSQRYSSDGSTLANNYMVTNISDSVQYESDVKLWNGRIYNTWTDNRAGGTGYDIWANVLDWNNPVGVEDKETLEIPSAFSLSQNYPNPFNPSTKIKFQNADVMFVSLKVYDVLGREIATLVNEEKPVGIYEVKFDAVGLPSGIYFYQIKVGSYIETKKMLLLK